MSVLVSRGTTTTANVGLSLARLGFSVVATDADVGLRNLDLLLGLENRVNYTAVELLNGDCRLDQALVRDKRWLRKTLPSSFECDPTLSENAKPEGIIELLSSPDSRTQEHAVTTLLNLSINETNKVSIVNAGAIPDIVDVLKNGIMEARENAAATLFSLSVIDENKVAIGAVGAIPALIDLLCHGSPRGKKDAPPSPYLTFQSIKGTK
ncbi:hypothetical protein IFM89_026130 [Coptis chinensis]|uniref:Uncharacterized protein n=1 Tax=Coptis chinensis TaxID=261450 RepID=A0A835M1P5_9MAGN|nr:hypothetical protein IFM89_026130 [Coptis chinensis]